MWCLTAQTHLCVNLGVKLDTQLSGCVVSVPNDTTTCRIPSKVRHMFQFCQAAHLPDWDGGVSLTLAETPPQQVDVSALVKRSKRGESGQSGPWTRVVVSSGRGRALESLAQENQRAGSVWPAKLC